jgi:hypothetical protein
MSAIGSCASPTNPACRRAAPAEEIPANDFFSNSTGR